MDINNWRLQDALASLRGSTERATMTMNMEQRIKELEADLARMTAKAAKLQALSMSDVVKTEDKEAVTHG